MMRILPVLMLLALAVSTADAGPATTQAAGRLQFRLAVENADGGEAEDLPQADQPNQTLRVLKQVELDDRDIESAKASPENGGWSVEITFTDDGSKKFSNLTGNNLDRKLAIVFDGKVLSAPVIRTQIARRAVITQPRDSTGDEAKHLAETLNELVDSRMPR